MTIDLTTHDVVGVGIGPFGLSLAALLDPLDVDAVFLDGRPGFSWHPGLMLDGTTLQVPYLADLVTMADPTSPHSFLNYLHHEDRMLRFFFAERWHVPRKEYDAYARWVAGRLDSLQWGSRVTALAPHGSTWVAETADGSVRARAAVLSVGSRPLLPACAEGSGATHASDYLRVRGDALAAERVTVIGSGQSAGEVFLDVLQHGSGRVDWFTRSRAFLPMEYSKLGLEHFSPDYARYFHGLPERTRDEVRAGQDLLYKGLSADTSAAIYDAMYDATVDGGRCDARYRAGCELLDVAPGDGARWSLTFKHVDTDEGFTHETDVLVLATGWTPADLPIDPRLLARDRQGRPVIELDHRLRLTDAGLPPVYVQNAELHTHGVGAPDLTLGALRAARIANALTGTDHYRLPDRTVFQEFGVPS